MHHDHRISKTAAAANERILRLDISLFVNIAEHGNRGHTDCAHS